MIIFNRFFNDSFPIQLNFAIDKTSNDLTNEKLLINSQKQVTEAFQKSLSAMTIRAQQLTQQLETKDNQIDNLLIDIKDKKLEVEDLNKRISSIECELKQKRKLISINHQNSGNSSRNNSSMSTLEYLESNDHLTEDKRSRSNWLRASSLRYFFYHYFKI